MNAPNATIRKGLIKLLASAAVLIGLILACISRSNRDLVGIIGGIIVLLVLPATLLWGIDASRVIKREMPKNKSIRILGTLLGIPQAIMGTILIAFGLVGPFIGVRDFIAERAAGQSGIMPFIMTVTAIAFLIVGYYYVREGLGLGKGGDERD